VPLPPDVLALEPELVALRRDLHQHPELAFQEARTAAAVVRFLEGHGLRIRTGVGKTGVVAETGTGSPTILLRVDMDGLPIQEEGEAPYASQEPGRMHACGHDGHTAIGAAAARLLARRARTAGRVRIVFQPAEEGEGGAQAVIADGVMEGVDLAVGIHLWNELPVGTIGVKAGRLMASVDRLRIVIHGQGGHGAIPQSAADPVVAAAHVVTALQTIVSRETAPVDAAVVTVASIRAGAAFNVIPDDATLTGTIRTFDPDLRRSMPERITRIAQGVASALRCRAEVDVRPGNPAVINDAKVADLCRRVASPIVGETNVVEPTPTMGGEDMACYFERAPGCMVFIGSSNTARGLTHPHHSPHFDFDEAALGIGTAFLVGIGVSAISG